MSLTPGTISPHLVAEKLLVTTKEAKLPAVLREAGALQTLIYAPEGEVTERTTNNTGATCELHLAYEVI